MSDFSNVLKAATATALTGGLALAGGGPASADPGTIGNASDINTLATGLPTGYGLSNADDSAVGAGQAACGTYHNGAEFIWTTGATNTLNYLRASNTDIAAPYR